MKNKTMKEGKVFSLEIDPLLETIALFTKLYHKPYSIESLSHGLPVFDDDGKPKLFSAKSAKSLVSRACERAGLKATLIKKDIKDLSPLFFPMILLLHDDEACIIEDVSKDKKHAKIVTHKHPDEFIWVEIQKLEEEYTGFGFLIKKEIKHQKDRYEKLDLNVKHWFWDSIKHSFHIYKDVVFASILINIFVLATPLFTRNVYNRVIPNHAVETLWYFAGGVIVIYIIDLLLKFTRVYFLELAAKKSDIIMSSVIFEKVLDMQMSVFPRSIGSFASNLKDFDSIRSFLTSATLTTFIDIPFAILFLAVIWYLGGLVVVVPLFTIFLILGYALIIRKPLYKKIEETHQAAAFKNGILIEALHNMDTIKTLGAAGKVQWQWEEATGDIAQKSMSSKLLSASLPMITSFLVQFNTVFVLVVGVYLISKNQMTMGDLIAIVILVSRTIAPMGQTASLIANYEDMRTIYDLMNNIVNQPVEREKGREFIQKPNFSGKIEFRNVSFAYPDEEKNALEDISFSINPGEKVGIIGKIGSGKSTLLKLIMHLYKPTSGAILIDNIDINQIDPADLRSSISYVDQQVKLFKGTLKENIKYAKPQISDEYMLYISKLVGVHDFAIKHPRGYEMPIGEQGYGLSGGQKQSVGIARALLRDSSIIVMDEPTNAMDQMSEANIIKVFKNELKDKTLILSTQKLSLLEAVDRVIVMHEGKIYLDGPKLSVLKQLQGNQNG